MAAMNKSIQIFKPGKHTAMNGQAFAFSESDLAATVAAYDPAKHEAPLVVGHPKHDNPAYGWVRSLAFADSALQAEPIQVDTAFAEMVGRGAFKKISASFYSPDSPSNPVPGVFYLRHVGFLGAQPPAVKGLRNPEFADAEEGIVEFADWADVQNASILRSLREWIIAKFGLEDADRAIPGYAVQTVEDEARKEEPVNAVAGVSASFTEKGSDLVTPEQKAALEAENARLKNENSALQTDNAKFKNDAADFAEAQASAKKAATHANNLAFAEGLVKAGKLLPTTKDSTVALMDNLAAQETAIEFGEGDGKKSVAPLAAYKAQLEAMPKQVEFGEAAGKDKGDAPDLSDSAELAKQIVAFQESEAEAGRTVSATDALKHITTKGSK